MIVEIACHISMIVEIRGIIGIERGGCYQVQRHHHRDGRKDTK